MNYIQQIAQDIKGEVPIEKVPDENTEALFLAYASLLLAKGDRVTASDVHNAWSAWMTEIDPSHDAIRPFDELDRETRQQDSPFLSAIKTVALHRGNTTD